MDAPLSAAASYFPLSIHGAREGCAPLDEGGFRGDPRDTFDEPPPSGVRLRVLESPERTDFDRADDAVLARAAAAGNARAARAIWKRYAVVVRSKLRRCVGTDETEDLVQDVFLKLFARLPDLRYPEALRSYLIGITLHVGGSALRRRRLRWWLQLTSTGELPQASAATGPSDEQREAMERFGEIMEKLGPHLRRVFELRYVDELRLAEVAVALDVSLATAKRHLARASARVSAMVEHDPLLSEYFANSRMATKGGAQPVAESDDAEGDAPASRPSGRRGPSPVSIATMRGPARSGAEHSIAGAGI